MKKIIIAIDGHSSCGKSTMAKDLARAIGFVYVDTGAMYRAVTLYALQHGYITDAADGKYTINTESLLSDIEADKLTVSFKFNSATGRPDTYLNGECVEKDIRLMEVSNRVSPIAALPFVRSFLTLQQQNMGKEKGIVMDGRDIGTAVFPNAELKIFVTASSEIRAQRRYDELKAKGETDLNIEDIRKNIEERDYIDSHREVSPLVQAEDAIVLDNSDMTIAQQNKWLMDKYEEAAG